MLNLSDDHEIFRGYTIMMELYNALKFITMLIYIQKILTFNLGVAFLKSVSICKMIASFSCYPTTCYVEHRKSTSNSLKSIFLSEALHYGRTSLFIFISDYSIF